ncbi:30S ribosomal protein S2 [Patescibacteria group bacterium]|nr:30S ribosomal protein S2 [Patescibacteria group bacterium]
MKEVSLLDMLKSGVHFGHQTSKWHPKMKPYIFSARNGVHIINLEISAAKLQEAVEYVTKLVADGEQILFLGTKRQAKPIIIKHAKEAGMPYIADKWLGGTFTNFKNIFKLVSRLKDLRGKFQSGEIKKYSKKERSVYQSEMEKLERLVGGIENMSKLPAAIFIIDTKEERTAVREARKKGIPIIAIADTNIDPNQIDYPMPGNDDATKSIELFTSAIAEAVKDSQTKKETKPAPSSKKETEAEPKKSEVKVKEDLRENIASIEEEEKEVTASQALKS